MSIINLKKDTESFPVAFFQDIGQPGVEKRAKWNYNWVMKKRSRTIFREVSTFQVAEIANFTPEQLSRYENSLKSYRDLKGAFDTSYEEGEAKGIAKGKAEIALIMKKKGEPIEKISEYTGLSHEEINRL